MRPIYGSLALVGFIAALYVIGGFMGPASQSCSQISVCKACWSTTSLNVTSDLCPNITSPCEAAPAQQQHNAVVDVLTCACTQAKAGDYADTKLNGEIESVLAALTGYDMDTQQFCGNPGLLLSKWRYG
jgi:hypothetical protein